MSSGFISEAEITETRKKRQEEWEKVRKADDPIERPEEPIDNRSLYDRLQEQKAKKDLEYEEAHKLKNMIKGLDDDEIEFLDLVDRTKLAADRKKSLEEEQELNDYRNRVATLQEKAMENKIQAELSVNKPKNQTTANRTSQHKLLKGVVVKRNDNKRKISESDEGCCGDEKRPNTSNGEDKKVENVQKRKADECGDQAVENGVSKPSVVVNMSEESLVKGNMKCIGVLPGMGCYTESSSDESSDSEGECTKKIQIDLLGRKVVKKDKDS